MMGILPMSIDYDDEMFPGDGIHGLQGGEFRASRGQHGSPVWVWNGQGY